MTQITIEEYINAYGVKAYDSAESRMFINEACEERVQALRLIADWATSEIQKELKLRSQYAGQI